MAKGTASAAVTFLAQSAVFVQPRMSYGVQQRAEAAQTFLNLVKVQAEEEFGDDSLGRVDLRDSR